MAEILIFLGVAAGLAWAAYRYYLKARLTEKEKNQLICCMIKVYSPSRAGDIPADIAKDCSQNDDCELILKDAQLWFPDQIPTQ